MAESRESPRLFDEPTLRKLEQLTLVADRVRVGLMRGDRRSRKRGTSIEFADYRDYARGDDLRRLDWNVFARLQRPFIKLLEEEEDLAVHVLLDGSLSMNWPRGADDENKFNYARRVAAALAIIGLSSGDQVRLSVLKTNGDASWGPYRGRQSAARVFRRLELASAEGVTDLNFALRQYGLRAIRPGLLVLISDLFSPGGFKVGIDGLLARGFEVGLIQLLSPDEASPDASGDVRLVDVETGVEEEVSLDNWTIDRYRKRLQSWQQETAAYCAKRSIHYIPVITDLPWQMLVMRAMRAQGLVR
ncbi:MAG: DUF58 domain-containing protein [Chloroflexota bacterium]|jgi:uncharacterized protein (DUF58 family)